MAATPAFLVGTKHELEANSAESTKPIESLISLGIAQTLSQGAYVYAFDEEKPATLIAFLGPKPSSSDGVPRMNRKTSALHESRRTPIVIRERAAADGRFADLPEFRDGLFQGVISLPLVESGAGVGLVNFCRAESAPVVLADLSFLIELSSPLAALVSVSAVKRQLLRATQLLEERKLLDRAKGLVQSELGWTEEQAYLHIRRLSRNQRTPMREIAKRLIQSSRDRLDSAS
jgi:hypothetical protein